MSTASNRALYRRLMAKHYHPKANTPAAHKAAHAVVMAYYRAASGKTPGAGTKARGKGKRKRTYRQVTIKKRGTTVRVKVSNPSKYRARARAGRMRSAAGRPGAYIAPDRPAATVAAEMRKIERKIGILDYKIEHATSERDELRLAGERKRLRAELRFFAAENT